jgi:UDP-glucose 4-epimerase
MRYVITGGAGYIGTRLVEHLVERDDTERVVIADVRPPRSFRPKSEYRRLDVRDAAAVRQLLDGERPDALVHLAFILNPMHDENAMYDVDVGGTHNVLEAASAAGTQHVLVTSSATAYGAFPDNPVPIDEDWPVRGVPDFEYARDKAESDRLCQLWALRHPDRTMTIVRPCIVFGPNVDNFIVRLWTKQPFQTDFGSLDQVTQFVHEDDLVEALVTLLTGRHGGAFNVAGDGTMTFRECASVAGLKTRRMPVGLARRLAALTWTLRMSETPPGQIRFAIHPWVVSNEKLKRETGWRPRHSSRDTFELTMRSHGALSSAAPGRLAQLGEHQLDKLGVTGSSPVPPI